MAENLSASLEEPCSMYLANWEAVSLCWFAK